jgi:hypothetical protein
MQSLAQTSDVPRVAIGYLETNHRRSHYGAD